MNSVSAHWRAHFRPILNLCIFGLTLLGLDRLLAAYQPEEVIHALLAVPLATIVFAAGICALGYLALVGYDYVAFRVVGPELPLVQMLVPSFVSFAVSNNAPASVVTAGGVRYRMYRPHAGAAAVAGLNVVTCTIGLCALAGIADSTVLIPNSRASTPRHGGYGVCLNGSHWNLLTVLRHLIGPVQSR